MFTGAQVAIYPLCDGFVPVILGALDALSPWRDKLRMETDDLSTLMVGPPEAVFGAMRDLFAAVARTGTHCVLAATVSRGCPGEPDDPTCRSDRIGTVTLPPAEQRIARAVARVADTPPLGVPVAAQLSLYPLGAAAHMDEIMACIAFLKGSGVWDRPKNFCSKLRGDAGPVFAAVEEAFLGFGDPAGHAALDLKVSANSPTKA
jgi:uncharacterized protein YqgV (UPF0045/DUF77 family)